MELRAGLLPDLAYEADQGDARARARNLARYFERHWNEYQGKAVALLFILREILRELGRGEPGFSDLGITGWCITSRCMDLVIEHRRCPSNCRRTYIRFDAENRNRIRQWVQNAAYQVSGDVID